MPEQVIEEQFITVSVNLTKLIHRDGTPKNFTQVVYKRQLNPDFLNPILEAIDGAVHSAHNQRGEQ